MSGRGGVGSGGERDGGSSGGSSGGGDDGGGSGAWMNPWPTGQRDGTGSSCFSAVAVAAWARQSEK